MEWKHKSRYKQTYNEYIFVPWERSLCLSLPLSTCVIVLWDLESLLLWDSEGQENSGIMFEYALWIQHLSPLLPWPMLQMPIQPKPSWPRWLPQLRSRWKRHHQQCRMQHLCEVTSSENKNVLVILTGTASDKDDKELYKQLNSLENLQLLTLVSGFSN